MPTIFDIEVAPNLSIVGLLDAETKQSEQIVIDAPIEPEVAARLRDRLNHGDELIGFNSAGYDTFILDAILKGAPPELVYKLSKAIVEGDAPAWKTARGFGFGKSGFNELDLFNILSKRAKLKAFEARLGMDRVECLPFDPDAPITADDLPKVQTYLEHDLAATEFLWRELADDIATRHELETMFDLPGLMGKSPARAAETVLVAEYCKASGDEAADVKARAKRFWNCDVEFGLPEWLHVGLASSPVAASIVAEIEGTIFPIRDGERGKPSRTWPRQITVGGIDCNFGLGGLHSRDRAGRIAHALDIDVSSYYPALLLKPGMSPQHLDPGIFRPTFARMIEQRLDAKRNGRTREAAALKVVVNSTFGMGNDRYSALFSPLTFLRITIAGQLILIAAAEKIAGNRAATSAATFASTQTPTVTAPAIIHPITIPERMTEERIRAAVAKGNAPPDYGVALFYVREREKVQKAREANLPAPLTDDPVIRDHRFCCNRREDDRLTRSLARHHRDPHDGTRFDYLGVALGRLTNTESFFEALTAANAWPGERFDPELIATTLEAAKARGAKSTAAYRVPVVRKWIEIAGAKEHTRSIPFGALTLLRAVEERLRKAATMRAAVGVLADVTGFGDFFASQVAIDLRWMTFGSQWADRDTWAHAGPGAMKGLQLLYRRGLTDDPVPQPWALARMLELQSIIAGELGIELILTDVQNAAGCELSKYIRGWLGEPMKRTYQYKGQS